MPTHHHAIAEIASLLGDPARAGMLAALMDGRALTASELAHVAGITAQTASGHLARLTQAGLLVMERQGRHHYHRVASPAVAQMLESVMAVATALGDERGQRAHALTTGPRDDAMRRARTCYDHLAGRVAVAMAERMIERGHIELSADGGVLTPDGLTFLRGLSVELDEAQAAGKTSARARRPVFCRPCMDWSERRFHIAGTVGTALCRACLAQGWMRRIEGSRALTITSAGHIALTQAFGASVVA